MLWETTLPACGFAIPELYNIGRKQMIVTACGNQKLNTRAGNTHLACSLP